MGERFCEIAERHVVTGGPAHQEEVYQTLHWGLELVLKAYLHRRGWDDQRCIDEVRHDLSKALAACEREGLGGVSQKAREFLAVLGCYSKVHRVDEFVAMGAGGWTPVEATTLAADLRSAVRRAFV